ncbi:hypothetical protein F2P79_025210 [Pimephales promelas]|nr:hypothetical protein F2P79_025210 [Pimephales promelas]
MAELAQQHMAEAQRYQKVWYDKSARQRTFAPGQKVLVMLPTNDSKLLAKWQGPFEVEKQLGPTTYRVAIAGRSRSNRVLHVNLLKEWAERSEREAEVLLIRAVEEEEVVDDQYLPSPVPTEPDLGHLSPDQQNQVKALCNSQIFQEYPGRTNMVEHDIVLKEEAPVKRMSYRIPERLLVSLKKEVDLMLSLGIIERSKTGLTINPTKCVFAKPETEYLGFIIGNGVIKPQVHKVHALESCPLPQTRKQLRSFLGMAGFYHRFIPNFSARAAPLTDRTGSRCSNQVRWTEEAVAAFRDIQQSLGKNPVLYSPDFEKAFILQTDASERGIGAVLLQGPQGDQHPVAFISRKLLPREMRYSTVEKEALAIKWALDSLKYYLLGREFTLQTDHKALQWLQRMRDTNGRLTRWYLAMQPFRFTVEHIPGRLNVTADYLSRCHSEISEGGEYVMAALAATHGNFNSRW